MNESIVTVIGLLSFGGIGALVKELLDDNALQLPYFEGGKLYLGFLGSMIIGATAGYFVDHSPITAFFAGYAGYSAIVKLIPKDNLWNNKSLQIEQSAEGEKGQ